jgi:hypothetical protein
MDEVITTYGGVGEGAAVKHGKGLRQWRRKSNSSHIQGVFGVEYRRRYAADGSATVLGDTRECEMRVVSTMGF